LKLRNLTGKKFGMLRVIKYLQADRNGNRVWLCECDCGKSREVTSFKLTNGEVGSCGCFRKPKAVKRVESVSITNFYSTWKSMIYRCENPKEPAYKDYGGRGISVCEEWHNLNKFKDWFLNSGFQVGLSIDRINNNGNYEPSNCRWATDEEQANNTRANVYYEFDGEKMTIAQICKVVNLGYSRLHALIHYGKFSVEEAIKIERERTQ